MTKAIRRPSQPEACLACSAMKRGLRMYSAPTCARRRDASGHRILCSRRRTCAPNGRGETRVILRMLGAHEPVPPSEIETVVPACFTVVEVVVRGCREEIEEWPPVAAGWEE